MIRECFGLLPILFAAACAHVPESDSTTEPETVDPQETIIIIDQVPDCEHEYGTGFEAQSINGQWHCVCVSTFFCGSQSFPWGGGGETNPTGGGGGTPPTDEELEEEEDAEDARECMSQCEAQVPSSVATCYETGWDGLGLAPISCATRAVGTHCQGFREYCRSTLVHPDGVPYGPAYCTTPTAGKTCKPFWDICYNAWRSSNTQRAITARVECDDAALAISDRCKWACVEEHAQGVTCDGYSNLGHPWGKDIEDGEVKGSGCCAANGDCVLCEAHQSTQCTFGDHAEQT